MFKIIISSTSKYYSFVYNLNFVLELINHKLTSFSSLSAGVKTVTGRLCGGSQTVFGEDKLFYNDI